MKKERINYIILAVAFFLSMFSLLFLHWYNNKEIVTYINIIVAPLLLILHVNNSKIRRNDLLVIFITILYIIINLMFTNEHKYFETYIIKQTIIPFISVLITINMSKDNEKLKENIIKPSFIIFNIYYIINTLIILKQIQNPSFMLRNYTTNNFYLDHIDGLLGANGTHKLAFFQLFCLYLNILFFKNKNKYIRKFSKIMFIFVLISSCYVSVYNDNRMYFFLILIFLLPLIKVFKNKKIKNKKTYINYEKFMQILIAIIFVLTVTFTLDRLNNKFHTVIKEEIYEKYIIRTYKQLTGSINKNTKEKKEERIELFKFSLEEGKIIGKGIGSILPSQGNEIKKHLGLNDINIRLYSGGILFALIMIVLYTHFLLKLYNNKKIIFKLYLFITVLISAIYFQPFTYPSQTMIYCMVYLLMSRTLNNIEDNNERIQNEKNRNYNNRR